MINFNTYIAGDTPVLVEFFATWCPHCQRMMPRIEELRRRMGAKLKIVQLDVEDPANQDAMRHFGIDGFPTFLLFRSGRLVWKDSGERTTDELADDVAGHL